MVRWDRFWFDRIIFLFFSHLHQILFQTQMLLVFRLKTLQFCYFETSALCTYRNCTKKIYRIFDKKEYSLTDLWNCNWMVLQIFCLPWDINNITQIICRYLCTYFFYSTNMLKKMKHFIKYFYHANTLYQYTYSGMWRLFQKN